MRLYASFDETESWQQLFVISEGNAATSSMQKLSDGNLAIFFEDGSIGNNEKDGCYALNYVVIDNIMVNEQTNDLMTSTIVSIGENRKAAPFVNGTGWVKSVTTNTSSGFAGIEIATDYAAFNREGSSQRYFDLRPSAGNTSKTITITAPEGYVIKGYTIKGYNKNAKETYVLTATDGTSAVFNNSTLSTDPVTLAVDNIYAPSTSFTFANSGTYASSNYALISGFQVVLAREEFSVTLNRVSETGACKSYATLYAPYDLQQPDESTKAYYITEVTNEGIAVLTETNNHGRDIPKNTAVVLVNSDGFKHACYTIVSGLTALVDEGENYLKGTLEPISLDMATHSNYYSLGMRRVRENVSSSWGGVRSWILQ